jgi:hypothetical protein
VPKGQKTVKVESFDRLQRTRFLEPPGDRAQAHGVEQGDAGRVQEGQVALLPLLGRDGALDVAAGQAVHAPRGEWVRYSTPGPDGAEYVAVCVPAFSPETVHRDGDRAGDR